jgi:hypothetical protein
MTLFVATYLNLLSTKDRTSPAIVADASMAEIIFGLIEYRTAQQLRETKSDHFRAFMVSNLLSG